MIAKRTRSMSTPVEKIAAEEEETELDLTLPNEKRQKTAGNWSERLFKNITMDSCDSKPSSELSLEDIPEKPGRDDFSRLKSDALKRLREGGSISRTLLQLEELLTNEHVVVETPSSRRNNNPVLVKEESCESDNEANKPRCVPFSLKDLRQSLKKKLKL